MTKAVDLVEALKREMRARRITYAILAGRLGLSEGAVKRMFALGRMTLERVDEICAVLGIDMSDVLYLHELSQQRLDQLSEAQEKQLIADPKRLLVAACVLNRWTFEEIQENYALSATECIRHLAALDKIHFIELLPNNLYRIKVSDSFRWRAGGPIERFFERSIAEEFLADDFRNEGSSRMFLHGFMSEQARHEVIREFERLAVVFREQLRRDRSVPAASRRHVGFLVAFRPWGFSMYDSIRRERRQAISHPASLSSDHPDDRQR